MNLSKPKFWKKKFHIFSILLLPITMIYFFLIQLKKFIVSPKKFNIPVICIGNIYLGGTGKTPISILIANHFKNKRKPAIVRKYYKDHNDEYEMIKSKAPALVLNSNRSKAIELAIKNSYDTVILDDGFQDSSIKKDLNILCFNSNQLIGNGLLLPSGPLRETMSSVKKTDIIIINGNKNDTFEKKIKEISDRVNIFYSKYIPLNLSQFKNKKVLAFAGIGNPENFFQILKDNNINVKYEINFSDHYEFKKLELEKIIKKASEEDCELVTTEKDYLRIKKYGFKEIKFLELRLQIFKEENLFKEIEKCF